MIFLNTNFSIIWNNDLKLISVSTMKRWSTQLQCGLIMNFKVIKLKKQHQTCINCCLNLNIYLIKTVCLSKKINKTINFR